MEAQIKQVLQQLRDPETGRPIGKQIRSIEKVDSVWQISLGLTSFAAPLKDEFRDQALTKLASELPELTCEVEIVDFERAPNPLGTIGLTAKAVIAVAAGKGGVGKSTAAVSLALALHQAGCKVGLLDADVYGPSIPQLTGVRGQVLRDEGKLIPLDYQGIPLMSIGFVVPPGEAVIWRGPMLHKYMENFLGLTDWGNLDYLIIDMPPGTGDVALSLSQMIPLTGAVIVCTPQEVALIDAVKAVGMFRKVKIPVIGLIENMSSFVCPDNGKEYDIFGKGGALQYAREDNIPFLGEIPINIQLRERGDAGKMADNFYDPTIAPFLEKIAFLLCKTIADKNIANPPVRELPVIG